MYYVLKITDVVIEVRKENDVTPENTIKIQQKYSRNIIKIQYKNNSIYYNSQRLFALFVLFALDRILNLRDVPTRIWGAGH